MEEKDMKKMSKKSTTEVKRTEYCWKRKIRSNQNSSLNRKMVRRHQADRNSEKMENNSVDHQHTTQPVLIW